MPDVVHGHIESGVGSSASETCSPQIWYDPDQGSYAEANRKEDHAIFNPFPPQTAWNVLYSVA